MKIKATAKLESWDGSSISTYPERFEDKKDSLLESEKYNSIMNKINENKKIEVEVEIK